LGPKIANSVLKEILLGYYSDPPGYPLYTNRLGKKGEPMVDKFGITLLDWNRGTNDAEAIHKQLVFGRTACSIKQLVFGRTACSIRASGTC
jgi:hypothetical protein